MHKLEGHLVLNVQNQYKDIAHMIEKDEKNTLLCKKNLLTKPCWWVKRKTLNKAKEDIRSVSVFDF